MQQQRMIISLIELPSVTTEASDISIYDENYEEPITATKKTVTLNFSSGISFINEFEYTVPKNPDDGIGVEVHKFCEVVMIGGASEYVALSKVELLDRLGIQQITQEDLNDIRNDQGIAIARRELTEAELMQMKRNLGMR